MTASSALANLLRRRLSEVEAAAESLGGDEPLRLLPVLSREDLPPEFEDILEVQVLGYRDRLIVSNESRQRVLDPVWTLVPKDR